jgi:hypothetical protein
MKAINKDGLTLGIDLQKVVVIPYALINLVTSNELISSNITNLIASRSLTVTDQQPSKPTSTQPNQRLNQNPSQVPLIM